MSPYDFHISTPRLYISYVDPSSDAHNDFTLELLHGAPSVRVNPGVVEAVPDREAAQKITASTDEKIRTTGYGRYLVSLKPDSHEDDGKAGVPFSQRKLVHIGIVSMQLGRVAGEESPTMPDVGFNMMERYHGKGYATEAVQGLIKYFHEEKGAKEIAGLTDPTNEDAKRLFRRLGFTNHGVRTVRGIRWSGEVIDVDVWTLGLEDGKKLEEFGF
jgi:RimJ/RimL family protein N-acetyltransferase